LSSFDSSSDRRRLLTPSPGAREGVETFVLAFSFTGKSSPRTSPVELLGVEEILGALGGACEVRRNVTHKRSVVQPTDVC
jgi:hypothetical protein